MSEPHVSHHSAVMTADSTLGALLTRIAAEVEAAAETAADLQSALSPLLSQSGAASASQKIQGLDLLEQTLRDLGAVLGEIAVLPATSHPIESALVLSRCKLAAVAGRLSGAAAETQADDLELF